MLRGTKELSHQQIQDELDRLRARVRVEGTPGEMTFSILTRRESLPPVLKLLGKILREPSLPENELEILKRSELADLEKALSDPQELAVNAVRRHITPYPKGDPRYVPTIDESMSLTKGLTVSDVKKLYNDYLSGQQGELSIVGDFESAKVIPLLNSILADWKASVPYTYVSRDLVADVSGGRQQIATPDKANANYFGALVFAMREDDPDYPALSLGNYILGGNSLSSRLGDRVRQKEGLSYGVGSSLQSSSKDRRTAMMVYAICNPANIDKVRKAIAEEFQRLLSKGIDAKELASAKQGFLQAEQLRRTEDGNLASVLGTNLWVGRTMKFQASLEKRIGGLTSSEIIDAMRRRIDPERLFIVTAGDFAKKESAAASR
jgi:zinc protease